MDEHIIERHGQGRYYDTLSKKELSLSDISELMVDILDLEIYDVEARKDVTKEVLCGAAFLRVCKDPEFQDSMISYAIIDSGREEKKAA